MEQFDDVFTHQFKVCPNQSFCNQSENHYFHYDHILPISSVLRKVSFLLIALFDIVLAGLLYNLKNYLLFYKFVG